MLTVHCTAERFALQQESVRLSPGHTDTDDGPEHAIKN